MQWRQYVGVLGVFMALIGAGLMGYRVPSGMRWVDWMPTAGLAMVIIGIAIALRPPFK